MQATTITGGDLIATALCAMRRREGTDAASMRDRELHGGAHRVPQLDANPSATLCSPRPNALGSRREAGARTERVTPP